MATNEKARNRLVSGGSPMTEGRHYWEVELTAYMYAGTTSLLGQMRFGLDHDKSHYDTSGDGGLY
jgi:hypothetical protein